MDLKRYALLVDRQDGASFKISPLLKELGLRVLPVTSVPHAIDLVTKQPGLATVVISGDVGPHTSRALALSVRALYPQLPIVWFSAVPFPPDASVGPYLAWPGDVDPEALRSQLTRLLRDGHYPPEILAALEAATVSVLRESFHIQVTKNEAFLRYSKDLLADISSLTTFFGVGVSGRVVVGGTAEWFQSLLGQAARRKPDAEADAAGELCNRILGRFKEFFERRGVAIAQATPVLVLGQGRQLRDLEPPVSVALRASLDAMDASALYVDLSLKGAFHEIARRGADASDPNAPGDVKFL